VVLLNPATPRHAGKRVYAGVGCRW